MDLVFPSEMGKLKYSDRSFLLVTSFRGFTWQSTASDKVVLITSLDKMWVAWFSVVPLFCFYSLFFLNSFDWLLLCLSNFVIFFFCLLCPFFFRSLFFSFFFLIFFGPFFELVILLGRVWKSQEKKKEAGGNELKGGMINEKKE